MIARQFVRSGIPACIVMLDKENTAARKGVFLYYKLLTMKQQMIGRAFGSTFCVATW